MSEPLSFFARKYSMSDPGRAIGSKVGLARTRVTFSAASSRRFPSTSDHCSPRRRMSDGMWRVKASGTS